MNSRFLRLVVAYFSGSALVCWPFLPWSHVGEESASGDARLIAWTLAWHARWPVTGDGPLDAPFFRPEPRGLAHSEPLLGLGLLAAPVTALAGPYVALDVLRLLIPVINALAMASFVYRVTRDRWASAVAGTVFGFTYAQMGNVYVGLVHLALVAALPLSAQALDRWWTRQRPGDLAAAVAWAGAQALVAWYAAVIALVAIVVQLAWLAATVRVPVAALARRALALAVAAAIGGTVLWPLAAPFLAVPMPALDELRRYSLDWRWYVTPPHDTWLGALMTGTAGYGGAWDYRGSYFVGLGSGIAAFMGIAVAIRGGPGRRLLWGAPLALLGVALSLGPAPDGAGWRLFDLVSALPGIGAFRVPGRMAVLVTFGVAMLAGIAVSAVASRARPWVAGALVSLVAAESYMWYPPPVDRTSLEAPPVFAAVGRERPELLLVVPMLGATLQWPSEADYLHFARPTWTPLVNGYGRSTSAIYDLLRARVDAGAGPALVDALRYAGVSHVLVLARYDPERSATFVAAAAALPDLEPVARHGDDVLYRVRAAAHEP